MAYPKTKWKSTTLPNSREELADVVLNNQFFGGRSGGAMLGRGFYANQNLSQAQKGNYGRNIVKAEIFGISISYSWIKATYTEVHGPAPDDFIYQQIKHPWKAT